MTKNEAILDIAKRNFYGLETLERQWSDSLDFRDAAVWCIKKALEEAYDAGVKSVKNGNK